MISTSNTIQLLLCSAKYSTAGECMKKAIFFTFPVLLVLLFSGSYVYSDDNLNIGFGSGVGAMFGSGEICRQFYGELPLDVSFGYDFGNWKLSVEVLFAWLFIGTSADSVPNLVFGSVTGSIDFFSRETIRVYGILGIGASPYVIFPSCATSDGDNKLSGPIQLQIGGGLGFSIYKWLEIDAEIRLRVGIPEHPEVVTLIQHLWLVARF